MIVGRLLSSGAYANATNSAIFNGLTIPVVSLTSYVSRPDSNRWGWHSSGFTNPGITGANETTITAAGAAIFGGSENDTVEWFSTTYFNALGTGTVLATIDGNIQSAAWTPGQTSAGGFEFTANRLLFNLHDGELIPGTDAVKAAFIAALEAYTPMVAIPEPSSVVLMGMGMVGLLGVLRRSA